jgi:hypothetical protein
VKPGKLNVGPYHLSCILSGEDAWNLNYNLPDEKLFVFKMMDDYFTNIMQFLSIRMAPPDMEITQKKQLVVKEIYYKLIAGNLYKLCVDGILR